MHWNGLFASLLFMNHFEFTQNRTFLEESTVPLLSGLVAWFSCWLTQQELGASFELVDYPDSAAEGQIVPNPQMALAFLSRASNFLITAARILGSDPDPSVIEIATHLADFNTNASANESSTVWTNFRGARVDQSNVRVRSGRWRAVS